VAYEGAGNQVAMDEPKAAVLPSSECGRTKGPGAPEMAMGEPKAAVLPSSCTVVRRGREPSERAMIELKAAAPHNLLSLARSYEGAVSLRGLCVGPQMAVGKASDGSVDKPRGQHLMCAGWVGIQSGMRRGRRSFPTGHEVRGSRVAGEGSRVGGGES
jgi:hypothetical protein